MEKIKLGKLKDAIEFYLSLRGKTSYTVQKKYRKKGKLMVVFTSINSERTFKKSANTTVFIDS